MCISRSSLNIPKSPNLFPAWIPAEPHMAETAPSGDKLSHGKQMAYQTQRILQEIESKTEKILNKAPAHYSTP